MNPLEFYARLMQKPVKGVLSPSEEEMLRRYTHPMTGRVFPEASLSGKFLYQFFEQDLAPNRAMHFMLGPQELSGNVSPEPFDTTVLMAAFADIPAIQFEIPTPPAWFAVSHEQIPHLHGVSPDQFQDQTEVPFEPKKLMAILLHRTRSLGALCTGAQLHGTALKELDQIEQTLLAYPVPAMKSETLSF